jgi:hypothetical protein
MRRDKEDPMMYHYQIVMRGYDLEDAGQKARAQNETEEILQNLGLDGVDGSDFLGKAKLTATRARGILSSVANGVNQLGR